VQTVIVILNRLVVGGTAMNTLYLIEALAKKYKVIFITGSPQPHEKLVDANLFLTEVVYLPLTYMRRSVGIINDVKAYQFIARQIKKYQPVLVHTIGAKSGFLGRWAAARQKVPVIVHTYHGDIFQSYANTLTSAIIMYVERWLARKTTAIIAISEKQRNELVEVYKIATAEKIIYIPVGIHPHTFQKDQAALRQQFRATYFLAPQEIAIGIVGRLAPIKNHVFFMQVIKAIVHHQPQNIRFFIIGDGSPIRSSCQKILKEAGVAYTYFPTHAQKASVTFTSWIENMPMVMAGLDIVALTSFNEGTPISLMEAQCAGKPVVAAQVGAVEEVVQDKKTGFLVPANHLQSFTSHLLQLIENAALRVQFGDAGKLYSTQHFKIEVQLHRTLAIYEAMIARTQC
jgi:glycosyltransferase involved in cell wall biosynthesis